MGTCETPCGGSVTPRRGQFRGQLRGQAALGSGCASPQVVDSGGGRGIRTPGTLPGTAVFKTAAIAHSAIPPRRALPSVPGTLAPSALPTYKALAILSRSFNSQPDDDGESGQSVLLIRCGDAYAILQFTFGINLGFLGVVRITVNGLVQFTAGLTKQFEPTRFPPFAIDTFGHVVFILLAARSWNVNSLDSVLFRSQGGLDNT